MVWADAPQPRKPDATPLPRVDEAVDWERRVREESTRLSRYRRPVTVVLVELDGFERLVSRLGTDAADRLIPAIAETLVRNGRATDHVARLAANRFGVLMPETDEIQAINYAERIRTECDRWLAAGSISSRIALGWACPTPGSDLPAAIRIAEERLQGDRRPVTERRDRRVAAGRTPSPGGVPGAAGTSGRRRGRDRRLAGSGLIVVAEVALPVGPYSRAERAIRGQQQIDRPRGLCRPGQARPPDSSRSARSASRSGS